MGYEQEPNALQIIHCGRKQYLSLKKHACDWKARKVHVPIKYLSNAPPRMFNAFFTGIYMPDAV